MVWYPAILMTWLSRNPSLGLCSDNQLELILPRKHLGLLFGTVVANLWNSIAGAIRLCHTATTFKICIKTYLFNIAYPSNHWFYQTQNIFWEIKCDGCSYLFLSNFYHMHIIHCFEYCRKKNNYINLTLQYMTL